MQFQQTSSPISTTISNLGTDHAVVRHVTTHALRGIPSSMPIWLVDYDVSAFSLDAFATHQIKLPASIARSVPKRQAEYLCGRLAAQLSMNRLSIIAGDIQIGDLRQPIWPQGIIGSISHTRSTAAALALPQDRYTSIGIDIEYLDALDARTALSVKIVNEKEHAYLQEIGDLPLDALLTIVFSAKESLFKGLFPLVGRYFDFNSFITTNLCLNERILTLTLTETVFHDFSENQTFDIAIDFLCNNMVLTSFVN